MRSIYFTVHAVERFREHFAPGLAFQSARRELICMGRSARRLKMGAQGHDGGELYEIGDSEKIRLVVKREGRNLTCVTVLPRCANDEVVVNAEENTCDS